MLHLHVCAVERQLFGEHLAQCAQHFFLPIRWQILPAYLASWLVLV